MALKSTVGDLDYARRLITHQLKPVPGQPELGPDALANMRDNIASAPAFSFHLRVIARVLERVMAMHATHLANGVAVPELPRFIEAFRRGVEAGEDDPLAVVEAALFDELAADARTPTEGLETKTNAHVFATLLALLLSLSLIACAHLERRRACRDSCADKRGPTWTLFGGPTLPPEAFEDCVSQCEATTSPADPERPAT